MKMVRVPQKGIKHVCVISTCITAVVHRIFLNP